MASLKRRPAHKIELVLPEWTAEKDIYIFAGIELVAKSTNGKFILKTKRCNFCGKCCMNIKDISLYTKFGFRDEKTGNCKYLIKNGDKYECGIGIMRPFECSIASQGHPDCCIEFGD